MEESKILARLSAYSTLFECFILRLFWREKMRVAVTVLGISLGVAVLVAIRLGNRTSLSSFRQATESVAGASSVQIVGTAGRFDELLATDLLWLREYGQISPVIEGYALYEGADRASEFLKILGTDILRDREVRNYRLLRLHREGRQPTGREFLRLLRDTHAIILTEKFAAGRDVEVGDRITLLFNDEPRVVTVRGLLLDEGPARAVGGNFALMDIAAAQVAFRRLGVLDRLDVKLASDVDLEAVTAAIAARLPPGLSVQPPDERYRQIETMIAAFHFNLSALGSLALFVGLFLIYNSVAVSVMRRRGEIGILRALGSTRAMVLLLFLGEALVLAAAGTLLGLAVGKLLARAAVAATATTVETFYIAQAATTNAAEAQLAGVDIALGFGLALPLALAAAFLPSREATRVTPVEAVRAKGIGGAATRPAVRQPIAALVLFGVAFACSCLPAWNGLPIWGYIAAIVLLIAAALLVPFSLWAICRGVKLAASVPRRQGCVEVQLAGANLISALPRVSVSVAALAVSLAMMISVSIMIGSFRETVVYWVDQTMRADLFVKPVTLASAMGEGTIAAGAVDRIRRAPDVAAVDRFISRAIDYEGRVITLGARDFAVLHDHGRLAFKSPPNAADRLSEAIGRDAVVVSESFSLRFHIDVGDTVTLPTAAGKSPFTVLAVYYDYSSNRGTVVMDRRVYSGHFEPSGSLEAARSLAVYLRPEADPARVKAHLLRAVGKDHRLYISTQRDLRREILRIFDSTFTITYALQVIAIVVSALGVISTLITLILDRRREISLLSILGATATQIRNVIVVEAVLLGGVSQIVGVVVGTLLSLILIYVVNVQSFGWTIQYHFPWSFLAQVTAGILVATGIAGLYPAARTTRWSAISYLREE